MQIQDDPSDEASPEQSSTGSDSDGEIRRRPKRTKLKVRRAQPQPQEKKNKYNIWCTALQVRFSFCLNRNGLIIFSYSFLFCFPLIKDDYLLTFK